MARKPRSPKAGSSKEQPVTGSEVMKMPGKSLVKQAAGDIRAARGDTETTAEELRTAMAAHKIAGIHPGSIKRVEAWLEKAKKTDRGLAAIATELAHLDYYRDVLGLTELLKQQGQMFARTEAGEGEGDEEAEAPGGEPGDDIAEEADVRPTHLRRPEAQSETPPTDRKH